MTADTLIPRGATIGRYVVVGWIAQGAMGDVYSAYDPTLDRKVAIKLVRVEGGAAVGDGEGKARLLREAQAIAKLSHPNVVIIHDVGTYEDRVFIAMELIEGGTLSYWLHALPRTWREVVRVFIAAGRGLQHAHEANLVHRDFKPENVMVRVDGEVRVMDFGLVRRVDLLDDTPMRESMPPGPPSLGDNWKLSATANLAQPPSGRRASGRQPHPEAKLTRSGLLIGTPAYMAPEQFSGDHTDARSDQFSFCVALYEGLFGVPPFSGPTIIALATAVLTGSVRPPPEPSEVPVIILQALLRGLSVAPADRYPSMNELLADLGQHAAPASRKAGRIVTLASAADLAGLLEVLLQRPVQAKQQKSKVSHDEGVVAVYAGDDGTPEALVHFDLLAAGSTAAALTSFPSHMVRDANRQGHLSPILMENLREVANVLTKLIRGMSTARLRIQSVHPLPGVVPPGVAAALQTPPSSVSFEVFVSDYPSGRMTVIGLRPKVAAIAYEPKSILTRALIVDDSGAMRLVLGRALRRLGVAAVLEAPDGKAAMKCLRGGTAVDAVFVDWSMPVMDGISFVRAVRADRTFDPLRIIMVTTEGEPEQIEAALAAGANEYMVKPVSEESLRSKVESVGLKLT
jgi:serine/threonine protein kinase